MIDDDDKPTLPAPHPDTPEWAVQFFNTILQVYQETVQQGRERDAFILEFTGITQDHEVRIRRIENRFNSSNGSAPPEEPVTSPGE